MRLNLAAFYNDYTDMQRVVTKQVNDISGLDASEALAGNFVRSIFNVGSANVTGFEAELNYLLTDRLSLTATLGLMENDVKEFNDLDVNGDGTPDPELAKKVKLALVPDITYGIGLAYDIPLSAGDITLRGNYSYSDERPADDVNSVFLDPVRRLDMSVDFVSADGHYTVSVFGKNLLDEVWQNFALKSSFWHMTQINEPTTWGLEFKYEL